MQDINFCEDLKQAWCFFFSCVGVSGNLTALQQHWLKPTFDFTAVDAVGLLSFMGPSLMLSTSKPGLFQLNEEMNLIQH